MWVHAATLRGRQSLPGCFGTSAGVCKGIGNENLKYPLMVSYCSAPESTASLSLQGT